MQRKDAMRAVEEFSLRHCIMSIAINYAIFKKSDAMLERSARSDGGRVMPLTCHVRLKKKQDELGYVARQSAVIVHMAMAILYHDSHHFL
jgi:hypothetical protein